MTIQPFTKSTIEESDFILWKILSFAWTELGIDESEYQRLTSRLLENEMTWAEIKTVLYRDILGYFALPSLCMLFVWIPVLGFIFTLGILPDWAFDDTWLLTQISKWKVVPYWIHYLNPLRWIGYGIAFLMSWHLIRRLKQQFTVKKTS